MSVLLEPRCGLRVTWLMAKRALEKYAAKRQLTRTPEPPPTPRTTRQGPLLFVVQKHAARRVHYDFRLELDGVLKSWAVPKGPSLDPADKRLAVEVEDHPYDYASFEGLIPEKQYGAGNVIVWDCGVYSPDGDGQYSFEDRREAERRMRHDLAAGKLSILLRGEKLKGSYALVRTSTAKQWLLIKHKDRYARPNDILANADSVLTGRTVEDCPPEGAPQIDASRLTPFGPAEAMPARLAPMLAEIGGPARSDDAYLYEPKLDGYRAIAFIRDGEVRLQSQKWNRPDRALPGTRDGTRRTTRRQHDSRRRDRGPRQQRTSLVQRTAEPSRAQDSQGDLEGAGRIAGGVHVFRPSALRRHQPAAEPVCRSTKIPFAVSAARPTSSARARVERRRILVCARHSKAGSRASSPSARTAGTSQVGAPQRGRSSRQ